MELILNLPPDTKTCNVLSRMGVDVEQWDNATALTAALFKKAMSGDVQAFKEVKELIGENTANLDTGELKELFSGYAKEVH